MKPISSPSRLASIPGQSVDRISQSADCRIRRDCRVQRGHSPAREWWAGWPDRRGWRSGCRRWWWERCRPWASSSGDGRPARNRSTEQVPVAVGESKWCAAENRNRNRSRRLYIVHIEVDTSDPIDSCPWVCHYCCWMAINENHNLSNWSPYRQSINELFGLRTMCVCAGRKLGSWNSGCSTGKLVSNGFKKPGITCLYGLYGLTPRPEETHDFQIPALQSPKQSTHVSLCCEFSTLH